MTFAPIALFVYDRPWHTRQTVEALHANAQASKSPLYIFSDAPKNDAASVAVTEVRSFIRTISNFQSVTLIERETNYGLARSIIDGVTRLCKKHQRVIVIEDDLVTSPHFLGYMNDGLNLYENDERVISIHGYQYPVMTSLPETFFLTGADCWGWATWKRGWDLFEPDGRLLLRQLQERKLAHRFDYDGAYPYTRMLKKQIAGRNNSWAIRWYASAFLKDKLTLYPGRSLVQNIGTDSSGTHCSTTVAYAGDMADSPIRVERIGLEENEYARDQIARFHRASRLPMPTRLLRKLTDMARWPK